LQLNPVLQVPVDEPTVLLFAAQHGCPMPPQGWQIAVTARLRRGPWCAGLSRACWKRRCGSP